MLAVPKRKDFFVSSDTSEKLYLVAKLSATGRNANVLVKGRQGCGKSALPEQFAALTKRPFFAYEIGLLNESGQLLGQNTIKEGQIVYEEFGFLQAIQTPNCVIELDELNRAGNSKALNDLFSILDDRREVYLDEKKATIKVASGVVFFATINEGIDFVGIDQLDSALRDRFYIVEMKNLPAKHETELLQKREQITAEQAKELVKLFSTLRADGVEISTRKSLDVARMVALGASLRQAITFAIAVDSPTLERILLNLHLVQGKDETVSEEWTLLE